MKLKTYTINDQGEVSEVPAFSRGLSYPEVHAATKSEAQRKLLLAAKRMAENPPELFYSNGAFCLVYHTGQHFSAETGTFDASRISREGSVLSLCLSGHATKKEALERSSFRYYASAEYQNASKPA